MKTFLLLVTLTALIALTAIVAAQDLPPSSADADAAYIRTLNERAAKIVASLDLTDEGRSNRVQAIIVQQYRDLSQIHAGRDAQIKAAKAKAAQADPANKAAADSAIADIKAATQTKFDQLHAAYLKKLSAELTAEQVDQVKDGMTYGVVQVTYNVYLRMFPDLTDAQKKQIMDWLVEAREIAMDQGTSNEKHAVFGKYKGRINNYLVKAGYDLQQGEANLKKASSPASERTPSQ